MLLSGMGLSSLASTTNADSLDYHIGVAISLLNNGTFPVNPEWFHSRLAGNGEVLNALGLSVGAEQFGALLQFVGVIGVTGLLLKNEQSVENQKIGFDLGSILSMAVVSAPVLLFLVSSPKPQFLQISMTTLATALIFYPSRRNLSSSAAVSGYLLICLLIMTASQAKFSFILSGGVIGLVSFFIMMRRKLYPQTIIVLLGTAALVLGPPTLWKYCHFGGFPLVSLFVPFPGNWPGYGNFESYLRNYTDSKQVFPLSLLVPAGIGTISTVIGAGLFVPLWLKPGRDPWIWSLIIISILVALIGAVLGQKTSRFFLEPFMWLLMAVAISPAIVQSAGIISCVELVLAAQAVVVTGLWMFGTATLLPSAFSKDMRERIMIRSADGYAVMRWADTKLPPNAVLLSGHRSMALAPRNVVSMDWSHYISPDSKLALPYLMRIKEQGATHVLVTKSLTNSTLKGCRGNLVAGPMYVRSATRNPVNNGEQYPAWIYEFKSNDLPDCAFLDGQH
jgi:hypothetical protein